MMRTTRTTVRKGPTYGDHARTAARAAADSAPRRAASSAPLETAQGNAFLSSTDQMLHKGAVIRVTDARRVGEGRDAYIDYLVQVEVRARA